MKEQWIKLAVAGSPGVPSAVLAGSMLQIGERLEHRFDPDALLESVGTHTEPVRVGALVSVFRAPAASGFIGSKPEGLELGQF